MMKKWISSIIFLSLLINIYACSSNPSDLPTAIVTRNGAITFPTQKTSTNNIINAQSSFLTDLPENANDITRDFLVVFEKNGGLWISTPNDVLQLTSDGHDKRPKLSKDGSLVVFQRGLELWVLEISTRQERKIFSEIDFAPLQFEFSPSNHSIYFTTESVDGKPRYDLNKGDGDKGGSRILLDPGRGGEFTPDSSWKTVILVQPGLMMTFQIEGSDTQIVYKYLIDLGSSGSYLPKITWLENGYGFNSVIPVAGSSIMRFMFIGKDGGMSAQIAEFSADQTKIDNIKISPDGSSVLYLQEKGNNLEIHVIDASTTDRVISKLERGRIGIVGWAPNSKNIIYWLEEPQNVWISSISVNSILSDTGSAEYIKWVNSGTFLFLGQSELRIMSLGHESRSLVSDITGDYDWILLKKK